MQNIHDNHCELCGSPGGDLVWENTLCRVVSVAEPDYPGFCRVILNHHAREMTDLPASEQQALMCVVFAVETALRRLCQPDKINLASLGNMTPHVHWHIIPRWENDRHFPHTIWSAAQRVNAPKPPTVDHRRLNSELTALLNTGPIV